MHTEVLVGEGVIKTQIPLAEVTRGLMDQGNAVTKFSTMIQTAADQAAVQCNGPDKRVLFSLGGFSSAWISSRITH